MEENDITKEKITEILNALTPDINSDAAAALSDYMLDQIDLTFDLQAESASNILSLRFKYPLLEPAYKKFAERLMCEKYGKDKVAELTGYAKYRLTILWYRWSDIDQRLGSFITDLEHTPACCIDRARTVLSKYEKSLLSEYDLFGSKKPPVQLHSKREWYEPSYGSLRDWFLVADMLLLNKLDLTYLESLMTITAAYIAADKEKPDAKANSQAGSSE